MIANKTQKKIFGLSIIFLSIFAVLFFFGVNLATSYYFIHFDKKVAFYRPLLKANSTKQAKHCDNIKQFMVDIQVKQKVYRLLSRKV